MARINMSPEQKTQLGELFSKVGPQNAVHVLQDWLNQSQGQYGPEYRDSFTSAITNLRDAEQSLSNVQGITG